MVGPNQWPDDDVPHFRDALNKYKAALTQVSKALMIGLAHALGLDRDFFLRHTTEMASQLVGFRYAATADHFVGCGEHTDCGFLTILWQDSPGLQVFDKATNEFIDALPIPGTFVVNLGDLFQRWTNDVFKSTLHRVIATEKERYSLPFFCNANFLALVEPINTTDPHYAPFVRGSTC